MAFNPSALWISPSSISDFSKCVQLYYLRSLYRRQNGFRIQLLNGSLALGQVIHECLEQYTAADPTARQEKYGWDLFAKIWDRVCCDDGIFHSPKDQEEHRERGRAMMQRVLKNDHFKTAHRISFPEFPKVDLGDDIILVGKLDWMEQDGDGIKIIDFKTGKNEERDDSIQLPTYAFLASQILRIPAEKIKVLYWYLDKEGDWVDFPLPDIKEFSLSLKQTGERMKMIRDTRSFQCSRGMEECFACRDMLAIKNGQGKLISTDTGRKQEIYILPMNAAAPDLPF